jgi:hypothetical protein
MNTIEELLGENIGSSGLQNWPYDTIYPQKLAQTSLTGGGLSVGIVRSQTKTMELLLLLFVLLFFNKC